MKPSRVRQQPFTLVEMLTVIAIIIVIAGMTLAAASYVQRKALIAKTRTLMQTIEVAFEQYNAEYGLYPQQAPAGPLMLSTLDSMVKSSGAKYLDWRGSGFPVKDNDKCADAFEQPLYYQCGGTPAQIAQMMNQTKFDLWSAGPDEKYGNSATGNATDARTTSDQNDDITNWKRSM